MEDLELLTVDQVSRRLAVGPDAVRRWLRAGLMRGYRLPGGDWRIKTEDVDAVLTPTSYPEMAGADGERVECPN